MSVIRVMYSASFFGRFESAPSSLAKAGTLLGEENRASDVSAVEATESSLSPSALWSAGSAVGSEVSPSPNTANARTRCEASLVARIISRTFWRDGW